MTLPEGLEGLKYEPNIKSPPYEGYLSLGTTQLANANDSYSFCKTDDALLQVETAGSESLSTTSLACSATSR